MKLAATIYHITQDFPQEEKSGLTAAIRRLATSIPGKLADAHGHVEADAAIKSFESVQATLRELQSTLQIATMLHMLSGFRLHRLRSQCQKIDDLIEDSIETCRIHREATAKQAAQAAA